jgi:hypothetical protein
MLILINSRKTRERIRRSKAGASTRILDFERRYQGQYDENMMGDYIWGLIRESDLQYSRKSRKLTHF